MSFVQRLAANQVLELLTKAGAAKEFQPSFWTERYDVFIFQVRSYGRRYFRAINKGSVSGVHVY